MHYLYTKEGVAEVLGLKDIRKVNRLVEKVKNLGINASKKKGGTEYFDIDALLNPKEFIETESVDTDDIKVIVQRQIESKGGRKRLQLCLFDFSDE